MVSRISSSVSEESPPVSAEKRQKVLSDGQIQPIMVSDDAESPLMTPKLDGIMIKHNQPSPPKTQGGARKKDLLSMMEEGLKQSVLHKQRM